MTYNQRTTLKENSSVALLSSTCSYCDSLTLSIPQLNLVLINIYRPPSCPEELFVQSMEQISVFLRNMESYDQRASDYLILGDFNFPFLNFKETDMINPNEHVLRNLCKQCPGIELCSHTSSERRQAQHLINFSKEFFLQQYIRKPTRRQNILDLVLSNNHYLINDYQMIVNSQISDHYTISIHLNYENVKVESSTSKKNQYHSKIPEFNFLDADEEDWLRVNLELDKVNWTNIFETYILKI